MKISNILTAAVAFLVVSSAAASCETALLATAESITEAWNDITYGTEPVGYNISDLEAYARSHGFVIRVDTRWTGYEDTSPVAIVERDFSNRNFTPPNAYRYVPGDLGEGHYQTVPPTWSEQAQRWVYPSDVEVPK